MTLAIQFLSTAPIVNQPIYSTAISQRWSRLYIGTTSDSSLRPNLVVATLSNGAVVGATRPYTDSVNPLPAGDTSAVQAIAIDETRAKLFLAVGLRNGGFSDGGELTVWDLDPLSGEPVGTPRTFSIGALTFAASIALHPALLVVYVGGPTTTDGGVAQYALGSDGWPTGAVVVALDAPPDTGVDSSSKNSLALNDAGTRIYLGTQVRVQVATVAPSGLIVDGSSYAFNTSAFGPVHVAAGNNHVWATSTLDDVTWFLVTFTVDVNGDISLPTTPGANVASAPLLASTNANQVTAFRFTTFTDAFTGLPVVDGVEVLLYDGDLDTTTTLGSFPWGVPAELLLLELGVPTIFALVSEIPSDDPARAAARVRGYKIRFRVPEIEPTPIDHLVIAGVPTPLVAGATDWIDLDVALHVGVPFVTWTITTDGVAFSKCVLAADMSHDEGRTVAVSRTSTYDNLEVASAYAFKYIMPSYSFDGTTGMPPWAPKNIEQSRVVATQFTEGWAEFYRITAARCGLRYQDRPKEFVVSTENVHGLESPSVQNLQAMVLALALLGFNCVTPQAIGMTHARVNAIFDANGLTKRSIPSIPFGVPPFPELPFDWTITVDVQAAVAAYVDFLINNPSTEGYYLQFAYQIWIAQLLDEPAWFYNARVAELMSTPAALASFRAYLQQVLPPDGYLLFGVSSWDDVTPYNPFTSTTVDTPARPSRDPSLFPDLASRYRFYWTMRFFPWSIAKGCAEFAAAWRSLAPNLRACTVNDERDSLWYQGRPNTAPVVGETSTGSPDRLLGGRLSAFTPWTEDPSDEQTYLQEWSFQADMLRCAAALDPVDLGMGAYVRGDVQGFYPHDTSFRILSLVGAGAKTISVYTWGPQRGFGDGYADDFSVYPYIAEAMGLLGKGERLLYPGKPSRGNVAILLPYSGMEWNPHYITDPRKWSFVWENEVTSIHFALIHAGYHVDFVDQIDVANGAIADRDYVALYATDPNILETACAPLAAWVHAGGILVATSAALVADEVDQDAPGAGILDVVLGLAPRARDAPPQDWAVGKLPPGTTVVDMVDGSYAPTGSFNVFGPTSTVTPTTASVVASSGGAAFITKNHYGAGLAFTFAYYPGTNYTATATLNYRFLPSGWSNFVRQTIVSPLRSANVPRAAHADVDLVEVRRLDAASGIALVVLDWNPATSGLVTISVSDPGNFRKATSVRHGALPATMVGGVLQIALTLRKGVDVILLDPL